jgi:hypothetical protein
VNPVVDPALSPEGALAFANAAVDAGVAQAPDDGYTLRWARFDNTSGEATPIAETSTASTGAQAPDLPQTTGSFVQVEIAASGTAPGSWKVPVVVHFRKTADGWMLAGLERLP